LHTIQDISEEQEVIIAFGAIMVIIDGNQADTFLSKHLLNLTDHKVISSQSAHVLNDNGSNVSDLNLIHHLNEA
jgi:glycine cleavage system aminomethyltransferase T